MDNANTGGVESSPEIEAVDTFDDFNSDGSSEESSSTSESGSFDAFEDDVPGEEEGSDLQSSNLDSKEKQEMKDEKDPKAEDSDEDDSDEPSEEDSDGDSEEDESGKESSPKEKVKTAKGKLGDDAFDVPEEATFAVPVDGKKQFPTLKELKANFSGKVSYDEKFQEISTENLKIKADRDAMESDKSGLMTQVDQVRDIVKDVMSADSKHSAFAPMELLCNLTGVSAFDYNRKMVELYTPVIEALSDATEAEVDGYWNGLENSYLKSNQAAASKQSQDSETLKEQSAGFTKKMESLGVTQDDFSIARQELKAAGHDFFDNKDAVLHYLEVKPMYNIAEKVSEKHRDLFEPEVFESLNQDLVQHMKENPEDANIEKMTEFLSEIFELPEEIVHDLKKKAPVKQAKPKKSNNVITEDNYESFNDLD